MKLRHKIARHIFAATMSFRIWYPAHEERTESSLFRQTRKHLIDELDSGCMVCDSKFHRELHHWYVEWAFSNAIDWGKMKEQHPNFNWDEFKNPEDFVDSEYNCRVLCRKHHRLQGFGIHNLPYPIWLEQLHAPEDWKFKALNKKS